MQEGVAPAHCDLIKMAVGTPTCNPPAALRVKSTGRFGLDAVKVTVTGLNVPGVNAGILTVALTGAPTTVSDCNPSPVLTCSTVTDPGSLVTPNVTIPPGFKSPSVTVVVGVHGGVAPAHRALILMAWVTFAARKVKSTGSAGLIVVKVTVTGANVPGVNAGILIVALTGIPTTVSECKPVPALTWSTVTVPGPDDTPNDAKPPGPKSPSVTVVVGVHGGGGGGPAHRALILMAWVTFAARKVKSTGSAGLIVVKVTVTGANVPGVNAGILIVALTGIPTTVSECKPVPALTWSTVTVPGPDDTPNDAKPPGKRSPSVTVVVGVHGGGGGIIGSHCDLIKMAWVEFAARKVKSTGSAGLTAVKVTVTGANVPGVIGGIVTIALFGAPTTVSDCKPVPELIWSTVTDPGPDATPNDAKPPGAEAGSALTITTGEQSCEIAGDANRENKIKNDKWP